MLVLERNISIFTNFRLGQTAFSHEPTDYIAITDKPKVMTTGQVYMKEKSRSTIVFLGRICDHLHKVCLKGFEGVHKCLNVVYRREGAGF